MAEFSELIKNFNKIRDFMRDFYIYGFKSREDFAHKSPRTYDNEKRRCESFLGDWMQWSYVGGNKVSFVSADCGKLTANPLFSAWKSKSFTNNDIMLHFYILSALQECEKSAELLTEEISYKSEKTFDLQTVRGKCNEYVTLGLLIREKRGKAYVYNLKQNDVPFCEEVLDAVKFFQSGNLGIIGNYILNSHNEVNDCFLFKHHYIAHTLEDSVVLDILQAMHEHKQIEIVWVGTKSGQTVKDIVVPLKILSSNTSGRRYLCVYLCAPKRFICFRLDMIKSIKELAVIPNYLELQDALQRNLNMAWGVSFNGSARNEQFSLLLKIDEQHERFVIERIQREGRGGTLQRIEKDTYKFTKQVFDVNEAMPWIKTFIGRIVAFEASSWLKNKLRTDLKSMAALYNIPVSNGTKTQIHKMKQATLAQGEEHHE